MSLLYMYVYKCYLFRYITCYYKMLYNDCYIPLKDAK